MLFGVPGLSFSPERRFTQPLSLEDGRAPQLIRATIYTLSAFIVVIVMWASFTQIREITVAPGQIIPLGALYSVQHYEGGLVSEILVQDGDLVAAGDPLVRLQPVQSSSDFDQMIVRSANLHLQLSRLMAEEAGSTPDFGSWGRKFPDLMEKQLAVYETNTLTRRKESDMYAARVQQRQAEHDTVKADLAAAQTQLEIIGQQFQIQERLLKQGYGVRRTYLEAQAAYQRGRAAVAEAQGKLASSRAALDEVIQAKAEADAVMQKRISDERAKAGSELAETEKILAKHEDRVERLVVRSPATGIVQDMSHRASGEVIRSGDVIAKILPTGRDMVADVRISPSDIGHIKVGAAADLKLTTFDAATYGVIKGVVEKISATTLDPRVSGIANPADPSTLQPYYRATIRLEEEYIGKGTLKRAVLPGMFVHAEIITGEKSLTRYMLKPVFNSLDRAFSER